MTDSPDVSVVMSVYNGSCHLRETIDSVLSQEGVSLEFIIVNDGSTDDSAAILEEYPTRDRRVRLIHQENRGLTRALINGCAKAKGKYIARQDVGDKSLPGRLAKQLNTMDTSPAAAFVSCGTRYVETHGEYLYDVVSSPDDAKARLLSLELRILRGPSSHPSTLFSKSFYERVGGYRSCFYFAQDLDLWIRMAERGEYLVMPEVLYQASFGIGTISGLYRREQFDTARLILESAGLRRSGQDDRPVLEKAQMIGPSGSRKLSRMAEARWLYFIGMCLRQNSSPRASGYFREALSAYPLHLKSALRLLLG